MRIEVQLNAKDILRFNIWHRHRRTFVGKMMVAISFLMIIFLFLALIIRIDGRGFSISQALWPLALPGLWLLLPGLAVLQFLSTARSNPNLFNTVYDVTCEGVSLKSHDYSGIDNWSLYYEVVETSSDFFFYINSQQARLIPKREMSLPQVEELRTMIYEQVPRDRVRAVCNQGASGNG